MTGPISMAALFGNAATSLLAGREHDLMAPLLLLVLGAALGVALICLLLVGYVLRSRRPSLTSGAPVDRSMLDTRAWKVHAAIHGAPSRWLAIRTTNIQWVQMALRLDNPLSCSWEEGICAAHDQKLFISPAIGGWTLVLGSSLPDPSDNPDQVFQFVTQLSRKLGEVQFFSFNRAVSHHAWVHADQGCVQRGYAWAGHTVWNQGKISRAEVDLRIKCFDYGVPDQEVNPNERACASTNTDRVPLLASRWSIDPAAINARMLREANGITGGLSQFKFH